MLYSEIKSLVDSEGADVIRFVYQESNRPAVKTLLAHKYAAEILNAFFEQTSDKQEVMWMVDAITLYQDIQTVIGDIEQSAKLLHAIIVDDETDYETEQYRIIDANYIHEILASELESDEYMLGSFQAWCISDATGWPVDLIEIAQKAGEYEKIGGNMTSGQISDLAEIYANNDGYGHHFASFDGVTNEISIKASGKSKLAYYLFRTN